MYPLNDNDLDRLSREAAEHYDVESSATGWEALEKRLDREIPHQEDKDRRRFLFWLFFIAVMTGGTLVYMLNGNTTSKNALAQNKAKDNIVNSTTSSATQEDKTPTDKISTDNTSINKTAADKAAIVKPGNEATTPASNNKQETTIIDKAQKSSIAPGSNNNKDNITTAPSVTGAERNKGNITSSNRKGNKLPILVTGSKTRASKPVSDKPVKEVVDHQDVVNRDNNAIDDNKSDIAANDKQTEPVVTPAPVTTDKVADKAANKTKDEPKPVTEEAAPKKAPITSKKSARPGFELGVVIGPDLTKVKFKAGDKAGINVGLQLGYRFNDRWSVNSGLIYTKKNYKAAGEDFTPPKHYWTNYVKLDKLQGNCAMWEVPLNLRYDLTTGKQQRFFASAGLSTYFMTSQYYNYWYYDNSGNYKQSPRVGYDSTFNHFFSIVNFSAGYERSIGSGFSIQAEPYLKLPLKGLGLGSLKMDSYGILFSVKYKIGAAKK